MKVAHICTSSLSHKVLIDKLELLNKKNYSIDLISSDEGYDASLLKDTGVNIKFVKMEREVSLVKDIKSIFDMYKLLKKERYDIIHTHTAKGGLIGRIASKMARIPVTIHTSHGLTFYKGQPFIKYHIYKLFEKLGARFCDVLLSQNKEDIKNLQSISQGRPVLYEGNGINLEKIDEKYQNYSNSNTEIKNNYNLNGKYVFLVAARFEAVKDHDFLIEGIKCLVDKYKTKDFIVLLAGKGELEKDIRDKIQQYNLSHIVKLIGYQSEIYRFINIADAVVLTSQKEGVPRIIMESMFGEKLVIGTDVLGTRELIIPNKTGLLVKYREVNDLAKQLYVALEKDNTKLRKNARAYIAENHTESQVVERLDELYEKTYKIKAGVN